MSFPPLYPLFILFIFPLIGGLLSRYTNKDRKNTIKVFLAFSGSFLFAICLLNFLPETYHHLGGSAAYWVMGGFFFQIFLEYFTKGIEHGHAHVSGITHLTPLFIGLGLHSFLEGIPVATSFGDEHYRVGLLYGIALHELPAAFVLMITIKALKPQTFILPWIILYALFCPLGAITGFYVEHFSHDNMVFQYLLAFVSGTFLHISTTILFESSNNHQFSNIKTLSVLVGAAIAIMISLQTGHGHHH
jgi:zinc and cadmium transporter